jgi:hypothetical protein
MVPPQQRAAFARHVDPGGPAAVTKLGGSRLVAKADLEHLLFPCHTASSAFADCGEADDENSSECKPVGKAWYKNSSSGAPRGTVPMHPPSRGKLESVDEPIRSSMCLGAAVTFAIVPAALFPEPSTRCIAWFPNASLKSSFRHACNATRQRTDNTTINGAPDRIRTCDLCLRRATLYPTELRVLVARP